MKRYLQYLNVDSSYSLFIMVLSNVGCMEVLYNMCVCPGTTCDQPYVPVNGEFVCSEEEEGINCTLHCKDGYSFTQDAVHSYFCAYNGVWKPPYSPERPDCSGKHNTGVLLIITSAVHTYFVLLGFG